MSQVVDRRSEGTSRRWLPHGTFTELEFAGLPEPVCRYFAAAIAPGVPLDGAVQVDIEGHVRRRHLWTPFRAHYEITRHFDFLGVGAAVQLGAGVRAVCRRGGETACRAGWDHSVAGSRRR